MFQASFRYRLLVCSVIISVIIFVAWGCGGSCTLTTGAVAGWVYQLPDGSSVMITGDRIAPDGYVPSEGAYVYLLEGPEHDDTGDANGRYAIHGIAPGTWTIIVEAPDGTELARVIVQVRAGRTTIGGGHSEGGGGA